MRTLLTGLIGLALAGTGSTMDIIAHRGASADAPENTLAAVKLAWAQQADAVEVDLYLSKDRQIVVSHDPTTKRTAGVDRNVQDQTLTELRALDVGRWKGPQWSGQRIPTLEELLVTIPTGKRLVLEIKGGPELLPILQETLERAHAKPAQIVLIGFSYPTMCLARERFPRHQVYWLSEFKQDPVTKSWSPTAEELIGKARTARFDGLNVNCQEPVNAAFVQKVKAENLQVYVWTVNDGAVARRLVEAGVAGITTDRPGWLREQLGIRTLSGGRE